MSIKLFLDANGGSLAFKKEVDVVAYPDTVWLEVDTGDLPISLPTSSSIESLSQDVGIYRNGMLRIRTTDQAATWTIKCYEGTTPTPSPGGEEMCFMYDSEISGTGNTVIKVDVQGVKYLFVLVTALSTGTMYIEWAPLEWEEAE